MKKVAAHKEIHHQHKMMRDHHAKEMRHHESEMKKHMDAKEDKAMVKKMVKPSALKK